MKRFNKNIVLFVLSSVFVLSGFFGGFFQDLKSEFIVFKNDLLSGNIYSIFDFKSKLDDLSGEALLYHDELMDLNSVKDNVVGTKIIKKNDSTIIKTESGKLSEFDIMVNDEELDYAVSKIKDLETFSNTCGADFMYVAVPTKQHFEKFPSNVINYSKEKFNNFIEKLDSNNIAYINPLTGLSEKAASKLYFDTDHHWIPEAGFYSTEVICKELKSLYGFEYNEYYFDINNYHVTNYENYFLGSYGKKVGTYFIDNGADDFSLITPEFHTDLTEEQPEKKQIREGTFEETFLYLDNIANKDYYGLNTYATYSGGDFRLQIMKNNLNKDGEKVLLIRDSYACVVAPFLALQTSELHIVDIRGFEGFVGEKMDVYDYIKKINPDYVLVLYSGSVSQQTGVGRFDFTVKN